MFVNRFLFLGTRLGIKEGTKANICVRIKMATTLEPSVIEALDLSKVQSPTIEQPSTSTSIQTDPIKHVLLVGDSKVGRRALMKALANEKGTRYSPASEEEARKLAQAMFHIYHMPGQPGYEQLYRQYDICPNSEQKFILLCFAINCRDSFEHTRKVWKDLLKYHCPGIPYILVGCKLDLRRPGDNCVQRKEGKKRAKKINALAYVECSVEKDIHIDKLLYSIIQFYLTGKITKKNENIKWYHNLLCCIKPTPTPGPIELTLALSEDDA